MPQVDIGPEDSLYYEYFPPASENGFTFVFFNALTGDTSAWEAAIAPGLRDAGHGSLAYNLRGQPQSRFAPHTELNAELVVNDAKRLLAEVAPPKPILVGLSIGGLFAARAWLEGASALGLVFVNTLRRDGPRLQWIGDALVRAVEVGGLELFRDLFLPLLMNEDWLADNRASFLKPDTAYPPLAADSGFYKLLAEAGRTADWDLPYESLDLPVLVVTGLQDHVFLELSAVEDILERMPNPYRVDMANAGHLIPGEQPQALVDALLSFVKEAY